MSQVYQIQRKTTKIIKILIIVHQESTVQTLRSTNLSNICGFHFGFQVSPLRASYIFRSWEGVGALRKQRNPPDTRPPWVFFQESIQSGGSNLYSSKLTNMSRSQQLSNIVSI